VGLRTAYTWPRPGSTRGRSRPRHARLRTAYALQTTSNDCVDQLKSATQRRALKKLTIGHSAIWGEALKRRFEAVKKVHSSQKRARNGSTFRVSWAPLKGSLPRRSWVSAGDLKARASFRERRRLMGPERRRLPRRNGFLLPRGSMILGASFGGLFWIP